MAGREIDDAAAAKQQADASRGLPRFIQLFAGKAPGVADGTTDTVEEGFTGKAPEISFGEPGT